MREENDCQSILTRITFHYELYNTEEWLQINDACEKDVSHSLGNNQPLQRNTWGSGAGCDLTPFELSVRAGQQAGYHHPRSKQHTSRSCRAVGRSSSWHIASEGREQERRAMSRSPGWRGAQHSEGAHPVMWPHSRMRWSPSRRRQVNKRRMRRVYWHACGH